MMQENKKKILITASTFPRYKGDSEPRFVLDLAIALLPYFDVTVLVPACPESVEHEILEGVKVVRYHYFPVHKWETLCYPGAIVPRIKERKLRLLLVPFLFWGLYWNVRRLSKYADAVYAHWIIPQGVVQSFLRKPYLVTGHGGDVSSCNSGIMKILKWRTLKRASAITVVSEALKTEILELYKDRPWKRKEMECKVQVFPMGCNLSSFSKAFRQENYWNQQGEKVILFVGRLVEKKGVAFLIKAMNKIKAKLIIVGTGPLEQSLKNLVLQYQLQQKVIFEGAENHEGLKKSYASADIFVMPSVTAQDGDTEGFGLVLLEAMASGLPVAAFRTGGIVQLIRHEENGLLAEPENVEELVDCIQRLIDSPQLCRKLSERALKDIQQYDYSNVGKVYADIINSIMGK